VTRPSKSYVFSIWGLIDLLAVLPSAMSLAHLTGLPLARVGRLLRVVRFLRLLRILKLAKVMAEDYEESKTQRFGTLKIDLQIYLMATFSVLVIASTLMFFAENHAQPAVFSSIPGTLWWGASVLTKLPLVGMQPPTVLGKVIAAATSFSGLALFGVLMGVVSKAMVAGLYGSHEQR
jgi:voltage-gated potassium channel